MNVYSVIGAEGFQFCHPEEERDYDTISALINGVPRAKTWRPIRMRLIDKDGRRQLSESDSPWLGSWALIFRKRAVEAFGDLLTNWGELLPIECHDCELYFYNPTCVLDALDLHKSHVIRVREAVVQSVVHPVFLSSAIGRQQFFKVKHVAVSSVYVGDEVLQVWRAAKLRGLNFISQPVA